MWLKFKSPLLGPPTPTLFTNLHIPLASNHGKAAAVAEPFARILGVEISELRIDSDALGTFSGEVPRQGSMLDALRGKVQQARALTASRFVLVSEGSFGAAGGFECLAHNVELLLLHDADTGAEIVEEYNTYDTNYATAQLNSLDQLSAFLERISFGSHALLLHPAGVPLLPGVVQKGITERAAAERLFEQALSQSPHRAVTVMSDMRAHCNPTRMAAIRACGELLAHRLAAPCARCGSGGFGLVATIPGLPCAACGAPTRRSRGERHGCPFCGKSAKKPRADGLTYADPGECDECNP